MCLSPTYVGTTLLRTVSTLPWSGNSRLLPFCELLVLEPFYVLERRRGDMHDGADLQTDPGHRTVVMQSCHAWHESTWLGEKG
jgi:hypothetical protein